MDVKVPNPEDHSGVLILVKLHSSTTGVSNFNHVLERLKRIHYVEVSENPKRDILPVFSSTLDKNLAAWGEFQSHRKALGLVFVGYAADGSKEEEAACISNYRSTKESLKNSLFNSRCLIFGAGSRSGSDLNEKEVIFYESMEASDRLETDVKELLKSIFWVMEGKRLDLSFEKMDSPHCPLAPEEGKYRFGLENRHSKNYRKKCIGRLRKQVADYTLLTGLPTLAMDSYNASIEALKASNDWLWLAGAYEGWCCAAIAVKYTERTRRRSSLQRVSTFSGKQLKSVQNAVTRSQSNERIESVTTNNGAPKEMENSNSNHSLFHVSRSGINPNEIMDKFKLALENYEKFSSAAVVECECIFKAASVYRFELEYCAMETFLREHTGKYLDANFEQFSFTYKAYLCQILGTIFRQVNFRRKSAFFYRLAALFRLHIGDGGPRDAQDYRTVYPLLYCTLSGNKIKDSAKDMPLGFDKGWADVQVRALHETYISASRAGYSQAAIRHLCYLLQAFLEDMEPAFVRSLTTELEQLAKAVGKGVPVPINNHLQLNFDLILRPVSMFKFPKITSFRLLPLPGYLAPTRVTVKSASIFIYTPFQRKEKAVLSWVTGCLSGVALRVVNPLPFELQISNLTIQSEGVQFEPTPVQMTLPPSSFEPITFKLFGTPKSAGRLVISGYSCEVLGVKNVTKLKDIPWLGRRDNFEVDVLPSLPTLDIRTSLPRAKAFEVEEDQKDPNSQEIATAEVTVYSGQKFQHSMVLENTSKTERISSIFLEVQQPRVCGGASMIQLGENTDFSNELGPGAERKLDFAIYGIDPLSVSEADLEEMGLRKPPSQRSFGRLEAGSSASESSSISGGVPGEKIPYLGRLLIASLCVKFHGGSEQSGGVFERTAVLNLFVTIVPAITITDWRVLSGDTPRSRYLALDVTNCSDSEAELHYNNDRRITVQSKEVCRVPLLAPCCEIKGQPFAEPSGRRQLVMEMEETERLRKTLENHVASHLDIFWSIPTLDLKGLVPIGTLLASDQFLKQLVLPPLLVGLTVNDIQGQEEHTVELGSICTVTIELSQSQSDRSFSGHLSLVAVQDLQNNTLGLVERNDHLVLLGPVRQPFSIEPQEKELKSKLAGSEGEHFDENCDAKESEGDWRGENKCSTTFRVMFCHEGVYKVKPAFQWAEARAIDCDLFLPSVLFNVLTRAK